MPELPDLVYIQKKLEPDIKGELIKSAKAEKPLIVRSFIGEEYAQQLAGQKVKAVNLRSPFLHIQLEKYHLVLNLMLAGRLMLLDQAPKKKGYLCFSMIFNSGQRLLLYDEKQMAKIYIAENEHLSQIPAFSTLGLDLLSTDFSLEAFLKLLSKERRQVRVFIMDKNKFSSIGNAYADEILFKAKIHPKTMSNKLSDEMKTSLYQAIKETMSWGIEEVEKANEPIEVKVRGHMQVRNRHGQPCPECGTKIRRAGVYGHDTFFCPNCQQQPGNSFIQWQKNQ